MINFFERLDMYLKYKGLNDNKFTIETGISNGLIGKARKRGSLSQENISLILYTYPELDANWLFTGKGEMLKNGTVEVPEVKFVDTNFLLDRIEKLAIRNNELEKEIELLFLLSFYLCGLNIKDLLLLKHTDVKAGCINVMRIKTNVFLKLKLEPEAIEIINRYKGTDYLLNIMDVYGNYDDFRRKMNKYLKVIIPGLTVYWARHTWATFAAELDVPDAVIDMAQAHKLKGMNAVYVARNVAKVYEANRRVIDYVIG